jgi:hypothetical protein
VVVASPIDLGLLNRAQVPHTLVRARVISRLRQQRYRRLQERQQYQTCQ